MAAEVKAWRRRSKHDGGGEGRTAEVKAEDGCVAPNRASPSPDLCHPATSTVRVPRLRTRRAAE